MKNENTHPTKNIEVRLISFNVKPDGSVSGKFIVRTDGEPQSMRDYSVDKLHSLDHRSGHKKRTSEFIGHAIGLLFGDAVEDHAARILGVDKSDIRYIPQCYTTASPDEAHEAAKRVRDSMACLEYDIQYRLSSHQPWIIEAYKSAFKPVLDNFELCLKDYGLSITSTNNMLSEKNQAINNPINEIKD